MVNIIASLEGDKSKFFQAEYATFKKVFPQVLVFPVKSLENTSEVQNIMLVGLNSATVPDFSKASADARQYINHQFTPLSSGSALVLTDDYAPVENYVAELVK